MNVLLINWTACVAHLLSVFAAGACFSRKGLKLRRPPLNPQPTIHLPKWMKCLDLASSHMMAGFFSFVGLVALLKTCMHAHGQGAVFLGMSVLVAVIAADSPVAGKTAPFAEFLVIESSQCLLYFVCLTLGAGCILRTAVYICMNLEMSWFIVWTESQLLHDLG